MQLIEESEPNDNLPRNGRALVVCENGKIISVREVCADEFVASLNALIDLAKSAGYTIVKPDGTTL